MKFELNISTDNAAFHDPDTDAPRPGPELTRILHELADRVEGGLVTDRPIRLNDYNGNRVGYAILTEDED